MHFRASLLVALMVLVVIGAFACIGLFTVPPLLIETERTSLLGMYPLVQHYFNAEAGDASERAQKIRSLTGVDVTIAKGNVVQFSTIPNIAAGSRLDSDIVSGTVFQVRSFGGGSSFVLSSSLAIDPELDRLIISKPDTILSQFLDDFLTAVFASLGAGLVLSILFGWYSSRKGNLPQMIPKEAEPILQNVERGGQVRENLPNREHPALRREPLGESEPAAARVPDASPASSGAPIDEGRIRAFLAALGSVNEGVCIIDRFAKIIAFNPKMEVLTGFSSEKMVGKTLSEALLFSDRAKVERRSDIIERAIAMKTPIVFPEDTVMQKDDGSYLPVHLKIVPVRGMEGSDISYVVLIVESDTASNVSARVTFSPAGSPKELPQWFAELHQRITATPELPEHTITPHTHSAASEISTHLDLPPIAGTPENLPL